MTEKTNKKPSRKEREIKLREEIIIEAAENLFLQKGYDNTTMDEIADAAEFSKGTLYNYFNSKDDLYLAIGIKAYNLVIEYTKKYTTKEEPGLKRLMAVGNAFYEFSKKFPSYAIVFHDIAIKVPGISTKPMKDLTKIENAYIKASYDYRDVFLKVMKDAANLKAIRPDKSPIMIGYLLSTITSGLVRDMMQSKHVLARLGLNPDEIIDFAFDILAEGLKPRKNN